MGYPSLNSDRLHDEVWLTPKITNAHDKSQGNDECNHEGHNEGFFLWVVGGTAKNSKLENRRNPPSHHV